MKKLLEHIFITLAAMFLVACGSLPTGQNLTAEAPTAQTLLSAKVIDPALIEDRYEGSPTRDANGVITRRSDVIRAYWSQHVCPSTGLYKAPCPGWALNHVLPRACGGKDWVNNLIAMREDVKRIVDSYERKISAAKYPFPDTAACPPLTKPLPLLVVPTP